MSVVEDIEKLILEVERRPHLYKKQLKEYYDKHLKEKLWSEVCESVVMNWSELAAEQKSEKGMLIFFFILLGITLMMLIYLTEAYVLERKTQRL
jgi:hypothetical protein